MEGLPTVGGVGEAMEGGREGGQGRGGVGWGYRGGVGCGGGREVVREERVGWAGRAGERGKREGNGGGA